MMPALGGNGAAGPPLFATMPAALVGKVTQPQFDEVLAAVLARLRESGEIAEKPPPVRRRKTNGAATSRRQVRERHAEAPAEAPAELIMPPEFTYLWGGIWTDAAGVREANAAGLWELADPSEVAKRTRHGRLPPKNRIELASGWEFWPWFTGPLGNQVMPWVEGVTLPADGDEDAAKARRYRLRVHGIGDDRVIEVSQEEIDKGSWASRWCGIPGLAKKGERETIANLIAAMPAAFDIKPDRPVLRTGYLQQGDHWLYVRADGLAERATGSIETRPVRDMNFPLASVWERKWREVPDAMPSAETIKEMIAAFNAANPGGQIIPALAIGAAAFSQRWTQVRGAARLWPRDAEGQTTLLGKSSIINAVRALNGPVGRPRTEEGPPEVGFEATYLAAGTELSRYGDAPVGLDDLHPGVDPKEAAHIARTANRCACEGTPWRPAMNNHGKLKRPIHITSTPFIGAENLSNWGESSRGRGWDIPIGKGDLDGDKFIAAFDKYWPTLTAIGREIKHKNLKILDAGAEERLRNSLINQRDAWIKSVKGLMALPAEHDNVALEIARSWSAPLLAGDMLDDICGTGTAWRDALRGPAIRMAIAQAMLVIETPVVPPPCANRMLDALRAAMRRGYGKWWEGGDLTEKNMSLDDLSHVGMRRFSDTRRQTYSWVPKENGQLFFIVDPTHYWILPEQARAGINYELPGEPLDGKSFNKAMRPIVDLSKVNADKDHPNRISGIRNVKGQKKLRIRAIPILRDRIDCGDDGNDDDGDAMPAKTSTPAAPAATSDPPPFSLASIVTAPPTEAASHAPQSPETGSTAPKPSGPPIIAPASKRSPQRPTAAPEARPEKAPQIALVIDAESVARVDYRAGAIERLPHSDATHPSVADAGYFSHAALIDQQPLAYQAWATNQLLDAANVEPEESDAEGWEVWDGVPHRFGGGELPAGYHRKDNAPGVIKPIIEIRGADKSIATTLFFPGLRKPISSSLPRFEDAESAPELGEALLVYRQATGFSPTLNPAFAIMLRRFNRDRVDLKATLRPFEFPEPALAATVDNFNFGRPLAIEEQSGQFLHVLDVNGEYLSALNRRDIPLGRPRRIEGAPAREALAMMIKTKGRECLGYYRAQISAEGVAGELLNARVARDSDGSAWFTPAELTLAAELDLAREVSAAIVYPTSAQPFQPVYERLRTARRELMLAGVPAGDRLAAERLFVAPTDAEGGELMAQLKASIPRPQLLALNEIKGLYPTFIGGLAAHKKQRRGEPDDFFRPDWRHFIIGGARAAIIRQLLKAGIRPAAIKNDAVHFVTATRELPIGALPISFCLGHYKPVIPSGIPVEQLPRRVIRGKGALAGPEAIKLWAKVNGAE
jgi:hypothetical protein